MSASAAPLRGDELLAAVTTSMIAFRGNELLICVLGGVYTDVEKTMFVDG
jgi:hypothetical protein